MDGAGGEDAQRHLTGTFQFGYFSGYASDDELAAYNGTGCGLKIKDEDMVEGLRLSIPADARDKLQAVLPAATAAKLGLRVAAGTAYQAHHRQSTLGRARTVARLEAYLRMDAAVAAGDKEAFDAAQRELIEDMAVVAHERYKTDALMRRGIYSPAQIEAIRQELAAAGVDLDAPRSPPAAGLSSAPPPPPAQPLIPDESEPWNFDSWFADATARRKGQDLFDEVRQLDATAKVEDFQLEVDDLCVGWDRPALERALRGEPPAKRQKEGGSDSDGSGDSDDSDDVAAPAALKPTLAEVNKMTVPTLKATLTELGCETTGLKAALKTRLVEKLGL